MAVDIGPKIGIEGEATYRKQINDIITQSKTLSSEMKAVTSEFTKETSAQEKADKQTSVLTKQIKNQEEKLSLLKDMLEKSAEQYGENDNKTQKWQQAVNNATADLNNMKNKLTDINKGLDDNADTLEDTSVEMDGAGKGAIKLGDIIKANLISDAIKSGLTMLKNAFGSIGDALKSSIKDSSQFADDILTMSTVTGVGTKALQEYSYMAELVDVDVSTITGSLNKLTKNMNSARNGTKTAQEAFKQLGITYQNVDGTLRDNEEVFYDIIEALGNMPEGAERDAIAMTLLGKSAQDLNPLIAQGKDGIEAFRKEAEELGYVLSDEELGSLGAVDDAFQRWNKTLDMVKRQIAVGLSPAVESIVMQLKEWVTAVDWNALGEQMGAVFQRMADALSQVDIGAVLNNIIDAVTSFIEMIATADLTSVFDGISSFFNFMREYGELIAGAFVAITGALAGMKIAALASAPAVAGLAGTVGAIAGPIAIAVGAIVGIIAVVKNWGKITEWAQKTWDACKKKVADVWSGMKDKAKQTFEDMKTAVTNKVNDMESAVVNKVTDIKDSVAKKWEDIKGTLRTKTDEIKAQVNDKFNGMKTTLATTFDGIKSSLSSKWDAVKQKLTGTSTETKTSVETTFTNMSANLGSTMENLKTSMTTKASQLMANMKQGISDKADSVRSAISNPINKGLTDVDNKKTTAYNEGSGIVGNLKSGLNSRVSEVTQALKNSIAGVEEIKRNRDQAYSWGADMADNLAKGLDANQQKPINKAWSVANAIKKILHFSQPDVGPLKDFNTWMPDFMAGLAKGINDNAYLVEDAINGVAMTLTSPAGATTNMNYGGVNININVSDNVTGQRLLDEIETELASRTIRRRAVFG